MKIVMCVVVIGVVLGVMGGCGFPYEPKTEPSLVSSESDSLARLKPINENAQVCNPSISQDNNLYPACMLWLGFDGALGVKVPPDQSGYTLNAPTQHDRLTVSDTGNWVRWYVMRPTTLISGEMQDPEWSSHPDFLALLGEVEPAVWSGFFTRLSDKAFFKWNNNKLKAKSDPYLWIKGSAPATASPASSVFTYDTITGMVAKTAISALFNTDTVKIAFLLPNAAKAMRLNFIDFSANTPTVVQLPIPSGKDGWDCENPQISPDGKWVAYHYFLGLKYAAYVQELTPNAVPILLAEGGSWPHWWKDNNGTFWVVYATNGGSISDKFAERVNDNGSIGYTFIRKVDLAATSNGEAPPAWTIFREEPIEMLKLPFRGGLSSDGRFLCTGYRYAYMYRLP